MGKLDEIGQNSISKDCPAPFSQEAIDMSNDPCVSENITEAFNATEYYLWMSDFRSIYAKIANSLPPRNTSFPNLSLENVIGCEVVCAAICHQINWDFLRNAVYEMTIQDDTWLCPEKLSKITSAKVLQLLGNYNKPERIREKERCSLLRSLGSSLSVLGYSYRDIFFCANSVIRSSGEILNVLNLSKAFSGDPEGKKTQLLLQNLSEYEELSLLSTYCRPAIDYHIIREFLRRGMVIPANQKAYEFIFNPGIQRKEQTIAALRKVCSDVFYTLQWITSCDIRTINTIEWWIGRSVCLKECPDCELKEDSSKWMKLNFEKCPFYESCYAIKGDSRFLNIVEPNYQGKSY